MDKKTRGKLIKYLVLWALVALFIWFIITHFAEIQNVARTISQGEWSLVLLAAALQLIVFFLNSKLYQVCFRLVGVQSRLREILPLLFASLFANVAAPIGGASGMMLFVDDAYRRGKSGAKVMAGAVLALIGFYCASSVTLVVGMVHLAQIGELKSYEIIAAILLAVLVIGLVVLLWLALKFPKALFKFFQFIEHFANKVTRFILRRQIFPNNWAEKYAIEFSEASGAMTASPKEVVRAFAYAVAVQLVSIIEVFVLFFAFGYSVNVGVLIAGYGIGFLFGTVSPAPQGIGIVEGTMTLVYSSLGIPTAVAAVVSLSYRGLSFWFPIGVGFLMLRRLRLFSQEENTEQETAKEKVPENSVTTGGATTMTSENAQ